MNEIRNLTPARYIRHLVVSGHTRASTQFCQAAQIGQPATAFLIAAIVEGCRTKDEINAVYTLHANSYKRAIESGHVVMSDTGKKASNHKPIMRYDLTDEGLKAWKKIKPVVTKLIARLQEKHLQA